MIKQLNQYCLLYIALMMVGGGLHSTNVVSTSLGDLISAITAANSNGEDDVIDLDGYTIEVDCNLINPLPDLNGPTAFPIVEPDGGHSLTIQNGSLVRVGITDCRFFAVDAAAHLIIKDLELKNGSIASSNGGAIYSIGRLTINRAQFRHNEAFSGGAIFLEQFAGNIQQITDSLFIANHASGTSITDGGGQSSPVKKPTLAR